MARNGRAGGDTTLVVALASGLSNRQAAKQAGCSERTVARRLADPAFRRRVDETRAATIAQTAAQLTAAGLAAVRTLLTLLDAEGESVRLGAAKAILELGRSLRESQELESRISALEAQAARATGPHKGVRRQWGA